MKVTDALERIGDQTEHQNALLAEIAKQMRPVEAPRIGHRDGFRLNNGAYMVRHVPVLQLAFGRRIVPDKYLELAPELARVHCPCGAVVELEPEEMRVCHGPEGGDCPRIYLYTESCGTVRVANTDLMKPPDSSETEVSKVES